MGTMQHHAIVVTTQKDGGAEAAANAARELGLTVLGPGPELVNGYQTICIVPDGSKEYWHDSDAGDVRRAYFRAWLRANVEAGWYEWVEVSFGELAYEITDDPEATHPAKMEEE